MESTFDIQPSQPLRRTEDFLSPNRESIKCPKKFIIQIYIIYNIITIRGTIKAVNETIITSNYYTRIIYKRYMPRGRPPGSRNGAVRQAPNGQVIKEQIKINFTHVFLKV